MNLPHLAGTVQILQQLASFDGADSINVVARSYPRTTPTQPDAGYREMQFNFPRDRVPESIDFPFDADEIIITLQGALGEEVTKPDLKRALRDAFDAETFLGWDIRAYCGSDASYRVKVFTCTT